MSLFGRITSETPPFQMLFKTAEYEVRQYSKQLRIETTYSGEMVSSSGFRTLAGYIFGDNTKDENKNETIAMTAPVIVEQSSKNQSEKIAMTAPVQIENEGDNMQKMSFILPSKYTSLDQLPRPNNDNVKIVEVPEYQVAAITFSGTYNENYFKQQKEHLMELVKNDQRLKLKPNASPHVALYNPPWTLWFLRTNEVMVEVEVVPEQ